MKILGIPLRRPTFVEVTAASLMATGLWVAAIGLLHALRVPIDAIGAGALLIVIAWSCVSVRLGIRVDQGQRHLLANLLVSAGLLVLYQSALTFAG